MAPKTSIIMLPILLAACVATAQTVPPQGHPLSVLGLDAGTRDWPGLASQELRASLRPLEQRLEDAMNNGDSETIRALTLELRNRLGAYAGEPERTPFYGRPLDDSAPDRAAGLSLWQRNLAMQAGRLPWEQAAAAVAANAVPPRLRMTTRIARAELQLAESNAPDADERLARARAAGDYLLSVQAANGVFGYPYDPSAEGSTPRAEARRYVEAARARGIEIAANGWMIEDLGNGALNFDNAASGLFLCHLYAVTGDDRYLGAARRAGEWAMTRRIVGNYNYNGFNGQLLSRLYRLTGEERYLSRARAIMEHGVMSGQMPNGRWVDQHNARIPYHAILMSQLTEFWLALDAANDPFASTVQVAIERGLDNVASELVQHGPSNPEELLTSDALVIGIGVFGEKSLWRRALAIDANYQIGHFATAALDRNRPLPESFGTWLMHAYGLRSSASRMDTIRGRIQVTREN